MNSLSPWASPPCWRWPRARRKKKPLLTRLLKLRLLKLRLLKPLRLKLPLLKPLRPKQLRLLKLRLLRLSKQHEYQPAF